MTPCEVAASYDVIASRWDGPDFHRENGVPQHLRALQFLQHRGRALDVGCGSSGRFIDLLLDKGLDVEGLDLSAEMIRLARARHPGVVFHHADICEWMPDHTYDFITAWDSIWHVPLVKQKTVLLKLCAALAPAGVLIFTAGGMDGPGEIHDANMGVPMYHATPGIPEILRTLEESHCVCRHLEFDQYPEKHLYLIAQKL